MSLPEFQRALCDMTLDASRAAALLRSGASGLSGYRLTSREKSRLVDAVRQRGMSVTCTLARANRFAPVADAFPLTCSLLKPRLRALLDELWSLSRPANYQLSGEVDAFAAFLRHKLSRGELDDPYADEILRYECAVWELIRRVQTEGRSGSVEQQASEQAIMVRFVHDPRVLLPALERDEIPTPDLTRDDYVVQLRLGADGLETEAYPAQ
jgi:hypothetical protein